MITRIAIEHFKSIESLDLELGPLTVIVGPNGSGKSNFVDALRFVRDAAEKGLDYAISERHGIDSIRQWSPSSPYHVTFTVDAEDSEQSGFFSFTLSSAKSKYRVHKESLSWQAKRLRALGNTSQVSYERNSKGSITSKYFEILGLTDNKLPAPDDDELLLKKLAFPPFPRFQTNLVDIETYSIFPNTLRVPQKPTNDARLSSSGDNLTSVFKALTRSKRHVRQREEIIYALRQVMPNLEGIRIQSLGGLMVPVFRVEESNGRRHDFNVSQISDGTLRLLGLLTALYQLDRPQVIAMEEPEQTVNPAVLAVLAEAFREVSNAGTQIVITTHSPHLVDYFTPEEVRTAEMIDGKTVIRPIDENQKQAVKDRLFSLGELMTIEGLHA